VCLCVKLQGIQKNVSMCSIFVIFLGTEVCVMWMKAHFHGEFVCLWSSCDCMFKMRFFDLLDLTVNEPQSCHLCHAICLLSSLSNSFSFHLKLQNSMWFGAVHMIEVVPEEVITWLHVWWTWWPGSPTPEVLWR